MMSPASPAPVTVSALVPSPVDPPWRSASRVLTEAQPAVVLALAVAFEAPRATDEMRRSILDVLAASGSTDAQATVRRLLATPVARRDATVFADLVQRVGQIARPDAETLLFAAGIYAEARREAESSRAAAAYALGACAGNARLAGDVQAATRATDAMRRDVVETTTTAATRASLVLALGNAGLSSDTALVTTLEADPDVRVRAAASVARRRFEESARVETALVAASAELRSAMAATAMAAPLGVPSKTSLQLAIAPEVLAREAASVAIVAPRRPLRAPRPVRRPAVLP